MKLCNFLVYFLPFSIPLWSGEGKNLRSFTKVVCILVQGRRGRGECGESARGLLGWQRQGQELAGHHKGLWERRRVTRPCGIQNEQPEGTSQREAQGGSQLGTWWNLKPLGNIHIQSRGEEAHL